MYVNEKHNFPKNMSHIYDGDRFEDLEIENSEDVLREIDNILETYEINILNPLREDKKLVVLDVDYTLTWYDGTPRDYLNEMLTSIYEKYDIVLWSAKSKDLMEMRIKALRLYDNSNYKFAFYLERNAMVPVFSWKFDDYIYVKALDLIWKKFPGYSIKNTIIFDDNWRNYALNRRSGLSTKRYREASTSNISELMKLTEYLMLISKLINLDIFDHNHWMSNQSIISKQSIKSFERAVTIEDDVTMNALTPDSQITLYLLASIELPDLPYHGRERQNSQKISKTLTFLEKGKIKDDIEILDLVNPEIYTAEMAKKIVTCEFEILNSLREDKKLLILDLGYTLCDPDVTSFPSIKARRPHSSQLLMRAYRYYDIVIWSDMSREDTSDALEKMGIIDDDQYKIAFYLTVQEMMIVKTCQYGSVRLKPLEFIWRKFSRYSSKKIMNQKRRFRVDIEWYHNKLKFMNVPADVTAGELKYFLLDTIGVAVSNQVILYTNNN